jgi:hypothetical protein
MLQMMHLLCLLCDFGEVHLFDVDVPNGPVLMESRTTAPGDEVCAHV